jgi:hypothetical protein
MRKELSGLNDRALNGSSDQTLSHWFPKERVPTKVRAKRADNEGGVRGTGETWPNEDVI